MALIATIRQYHQNAQAHNASRDSSLPSWMVSTSVFAGVVGVTLIPIMAGGAIGALLDPNDPARGGGTGALGAATGIVSVIFLSQAAQALAQRIDQQIETDSMNE